MKKTYCDCCGDEITDKNYFCNNGLKFQAGGVDLRIAAYDAVPIDWDICKYCVLNATYALDDRPRAEPEAKPVDELTDLQRERLCDFLVCHSYTAESHQTHQGQCAWLRLDEMKEFLAGAVDHILKGEKI